MMRAIDCLPYLSRMFGEQPSPIHYRTGQVLRMMEVMDQQDIFSGRVQRELGKIAESKGKRK